MSTSSHNFDAAQNIAHVRPLWGLREKIAPRHTALIVIDMQNDFIAEGGVLHKEGADVTEAQKMAARLPAFLQTARDAGVFVVWVRNVYSSERNFYLSEVWLEQAARRRVGGYTTIPVCSADSWGGDFYGDARPLPDEPIVTKHRYNGFLNTDLDTILRANGIKTTVFTGVSTNCCVESTARHAFMSDYYVVVVDDGTATYSREAHEMTLKNIDTLFGEVSTIEALSAIWERRNAAP
jgi:ureidoacrylate peracid hydrolase